MVIGNKKKRGITIVEVLITLIIMGIASTVIFFLLGNSNNIIYRTEMKSQLQEDIQVIQERLSKLGMESVGIEEIQFKENSLEKIKKISFKSISTIDENNLETYNIYEFKINQGSLELTTIKDGNEIKKETKKLSDNIDYILVKSINSLESNNLDQIQNNLKNSNSISVKIGVEMSKSDITETLERETIITFRNKN